MKFFSEGDRSKAICGVCKAARSTTLGYRDVPFSDGSGMVKDILVGVCDTCDQVAAIPAQSTPAISKARSKASESIEAVLPAPYFDLPDLACFKIDPLASLGLRKGLLMLYVHRFADGSFDLAKLKAAGRALAGRTGMESKHKRRLSIKASARSFRELDQVAERSALPKTDTIKAIIGAIREDIVEDGNPELIISIRQYSIFASA